MYTGYKVNAECFPLHFRGLRTVPCICSFRNAVYYVCLHISACLSWFCLLKMQTSATFSFVLTWTPFHFATCSTIPLCEWHLDLGVDVLCRKIFACICIHTYTYLYAYIYTYIYYKHVYAYMKILDLPDRELSTRQIILF